MIFRTASADASEEEIRQEYLELSEKLARIVQYGTMRSLYSCLYQASDAVPELVKRYAPSVSELVTDDRETYEICREYLERHDFHDCRLTWYEDQLTTLTKKENLENHVKQALDKRVDLPSGGFLVIEPTEALTAIDVNSGKQLGGRKNTFLYSGAPSRLPAGSCAGRSRSDQSCGYDGASSRGTDEKENPPAAGRTDEMTVTLQRRNEYGTTKETDSPQ